MLNGTYIIISICNLAGSARKFPIQAMPLEFIIINARRILLIPSVWPIPIRLWSFQQPLCAILYVLKLSIFCSNWREALPNFEMAVIWEPKNLHRTRTSLANFLFWRATPLQVLAILLLRLLGYNIVLPDLMVQSNPPQEIASGYLLDTRMTPFTCTSLSVSVQNLLRNN